MRGLFCALLMGLTFVLTGCSGRSKGINEDKDRPTRVTTSSKV